MKKTYIVPEANVYAVNTKDGILNPISQNGGDAIPGGGTTGGEGDGDVKGERGSGIWDLYN